MRLSARSATAAAALSSVGTAVAACWTSGTDFLLLIGRDVLRPAEVALVVWSAAVLAGASAAATALARHRGNVDGGSRSHAVLGGVLAVTLLGSGAWCGGRALLVEGSTALGPEATTVLRLRGTEGCTLIAHESGALRTSSGRLYAVGGAGWARPVAAWSADEIELPVRDGAYELDRRGDVVTLEFRAIRTVSPSRLQVAC